MTSENGHDVQKTQQRTKPSHSLLLFFETFKGKEEFYKNPGKI